MTKYQEQTEKPSVFAFVLYFVSLDWSAYVMLTGTITILQLDDKIHIQKMS